MMFFTVMASDDSVSKYMYGNNQTMNDIHIALVVELEEKNEKLQQLLAQEQKIELQLRMNQAALESQNEKLCVAQAELQHSKERYFDLYDLALVGYCTISEHGVIQEANFTA